MPPLDILIIILKVCLVIAAISTSAFPILYSFSAWQSSRLGQIFMLQGISFAIAMDLTAFYAFWHSNDLALMLLINVFVFILIAIATSALTATLWKIRYEHSNGPKRRYND